MEFLGTKYMPLLELGLSQIYLNLNKIKAIEEWFDPKVMILFQPLKVHAFGNGRYTIVDGHSRAFVAYMHGITQVPIVYENAEMVAGKEGQILYHADIEWCERFGIKNISHLKNRIISQEEYQKLWIGRCDRSYDLLLQTSEIEREKMKEKAPKLYLYGAEEDLSELFFEDENGKLYVYKEGVLIPEE